MSTPKRQGNEIPQLVMGLSKKVALVILLAYHFLYSSVGLGAQVLEVGFYERSCPFAESSVRFEVAKAFWRDKGVAAGLVRMHFHDCFVRGCEGSVLLDSTPSNKAEKDSVVNNPSLRGFDVIDNAKAKLERLCPGEVSCADILAFAARESVALSGGYRYNVPAGRRDGRVSLANETFTELPPPTADVPTLTKFFSRKGLTQEEMVTLSGAHTIGRSHCTSITNRLYNFNSTTRQDPTLDPAYAKQLKQHCPEGSRNSNLVVALNPSIPEPMDSAYYDDLQANRGLFTTDQVLWNDPATSYQVRGNAQNEYEWKAKFAKAMVKMGEVGVLTGAYGEIRTNCRVVN